MHTNTFRTRCTKAAALIAAAGLTLTGSTALAPAAQAAPGEGALALSLTVVKTDASTGAEIDDGATFAIEAEGFASPVHITDDLEAEPAYGSIEYLNKECDLPDPSEVEREEYDEARDECIQQFHRETYGEPVDSLTAPGAVRLLTVQHGHVPWDEGIITLIEVSAPDGFVVADEPVVIGVSDAYEFRVLSGPEGVEVETPEEPASYAQNVTVTVPNEPEPEPSEEPSQVPSTTPPAPEKPQPTEEPSQVPSTTPPAPEKPQPRNPVVQTGGSASAWEVLLHRLIG